MKYLYYCKYLLAVVLCVTAGSCRDNDSDFVNRSDSKAYYPEDTWEALFEHYWDGMNKNYAMWDLEKTDWDEVYDKYSPLFCDLGVIETVMHNGEEYIEDNAASRKAKEYFEQIVTPLIDQHYALTMDFEGGTLGVTPNSYRIKQRPDYHEAITQTKFKELHDTYKTGGRITESKGYLVMQEDGVSVNGLWYSCMLDGNIVYYHLSGFDLNDYVFTGNEWAEGIIPITEHYQTLLNTQPDIKGVIIDVRNNGGGYTADLQLLFGPLVSERMLFAYARTKDGLGRLDFSTWIPYYVFPENNIRSFDNIPIVVLADMYSVSMSEVSSSLAKFLPNGRLIGERTAGGTGQLVGGSAVAGNFSGSLFKVYMSSCIAKYPNDIYEGEGFTPDVEVHPDFEQLSRNIDNQLERAIEVIRQGV